MAFKMNPKSPALKSTGMYSSPVKQVPGPGPISSPAKQTVRELPSKVVEGAGALLEKGKEKGKELLGKLGDIDVGNIFKKKTKEEKAAAKLARQKKRAEKKAGKTSPPSPAKQVDKMGQRIIKQGEKAEAAKAEGNDKKATRHTNRAGRMNERDMKKKTKQNLNNSPAKQKKVASEPAYKNKLTEIGGKKAKSLKQEAKPLKPLVKSVNTLKGKGVAKASKPTNPTSSKSKWEIHHDLLAMQRATRKKGSTSFSSESQVDNGRNTKNTKVKGTKNVDGSKSLESYKSKEKWAGKGGEAILGKSKWVGTTASIDKDGNKSFEKDIDKDKTGGVWGSRVIGGANKSKTVNIKATSNTDGSKTINRTKTKDLHYVPSKAARDPSIPSRIISSKEKSLSVNVGADGSKKIIRTKKKRRLFGGTKTKTVTITKN